MERLPFFLSAPRTRSSVLFETMHPYLMQVHGLKDVDGHSEYFLMRAQWAEFVDARNGQKGNTQMMPLYRNHRMTMHHVYPPPFPDVHTAIREKLDQLELARSYGDEFNIKGTVECGFNLEDVLEFHKNRKLVITKRHDIVEMVASTMFAIAIKAFHMRPSNREQYLRSLENPVTLNKHHMSTAKDVVELTHKLWNAGKIAAQLGMPVHVTYYEDLNTPESIQNAVTEILETDEWLQYAVDETNDHVGPPIKINKDYTKLITNYDELKELVVSTYAKLQAA